MSDCSVCSVCHIEPSKYTCPACGRRTCSITCVRRHKSQYDCTGKIDPSKFVSKLAISEDPAHLKRDYNFLVNFERTIGLKKSDIKTNAKNLFRKPVAANSHKRFRKDAPKDSRVVRVGEIFTQDPQTVVKRQNTLIVQLPQGMSRSLSNKSGYDKKLSTFVWTVEWILLDDQGQELSRFLSYRLKELLLLQDAVPLNILNQHQYQFEKNSLRFYLNNVLNKNQLKKSLIQLENEVLVSDNLKDKVVLEFPTIYISTSPESLQEYIVSEKDAYSVSDSEGSSELDLTDSSDSEDSSESSDDSDEEEEEEKEEKEENGVNEEKVDPETSDLPAAETGEPVSTIETVVTNPAPGLPESSEPVPETEVATKCEPILSNGTEIPNELASATSAQVKPTPIVSYSSDGESSDEAPEESSAKLPVFKVNE